ncbi:hypothetical protein [Burkholderia gladioli]|uniref:hypothetical protein n=1 Tax=Burkholderia gladioli TaxID=28095 RepID=UPI00164051B4|nr:hypothetical protein [Burkholderia gladioli]
MRHLTMLVSVPTGGQCRLVRFGRKTVRHEFSKEIETRVFVIRRLLGGGKGTAQHVEVEAFIPEVHRAGLSSADPRWVDREAGIFRTKAYVHSNAKTLAPLLASRENLWRFPDETAAA